MTNEELEKEMQDVGEILRELDEKKELTAAEKQRREFLNASKQALEQIQEAKKKQSFRDEIYNSLVYNVLRSGWGEKHPILMSLMMRNFKWSLHYDL
ncbi:MAG: hypothetical protein ABID87_08255 [Chloroflexota bacterium]